MNISAKMNNFYGFQPTIGSVSFDNCRITLDHDEMLELVRKLVEVLDLKLEDAESIGLVQ